MGANPSGRQDACDGALTGVLNCDAGVIDQTEQTEKEQFLLHLWLS